MADQGLDASQAGGVDGDRDALQEALAVRTAPGQLEGHHPSGAPVAQRTSRQVVLRVAGEAGVVHALHLGVRLEELREALRVLVLPGDAERERLEAAHQEIRRERIEHAAQHRLEAAHAVDFNIHFHEGKDVRYPAKKTQVTNDAGTLTTALEQDYCWMWSNKGTAEASLSFKLAKN